MRAVRGTLASLRRDTRRATRRELAEFQAPPTPWRVKAGVGALVAR
jgi:hypothetical protein